MSRRRRKKTELSELKRTMILMIIAGILMLFTGFIQMNRTPAESSAFGPLHSWSIEYSGAPATANTVNTRQAYFKVNIGGRILAIDHIPYDPFSRGTPYYADEMEEILAAHIGDTVHYTYRTGSNTIIHMEIDGEVIVDQELAESLENRDIRFCLIFGGICLGIGVLLIPCCIILYRRQRHARLSARRSARPPSRPRR